MTVGTGGTDRYETGPDADKVEPVPAPDVANLVAKIDALTAPDREIDGLIMQQLHPGREFHEFDDCLGMRCLEDDIAFEMPLQYTSSIDAAMTTLENWHFPKFWYDWDLCAWRVQLCNSIGTEFYGYDGASRCDDKQTAIAIALCIATQKARSRT